MVLRFLMRMESDCEFGIGRRNEGKDVDGG